MARSTALTAHALLYYSLGLPAFAAIKLITPMYYSTQDTLTPARVGAYALALHVVLESIFLLFYSGAISGTAARRWRVRSRHISILRALFLVFRGRYGSAGRPRPFSASLGKMAVCAVAMAAA